MGERAALCPAAEPVYQTEGVRYHVGFQNLYVQKSEMCV